jgi:hypothetical protein
MPKAPILVNYEIAMKTTYTDLSRIMFQDENMRILDGCIGRLGGGWIR